MNNQQKQHGFKFLGYLILLGIILVIIVAALGVQYLRTRYSEPDRVHAVHFGAWGERNMIYVENSKLLSQEDENEAVYDVHRIDVIDPAAGKRICRIDLGYGPTLWLGSCDSMAWVAAHDTETRIMAYSLVNGRMIADMRNIVSINSSLRGHSLDTMRFDGRNGGFLVHVKNGGWLLIDHSTFHAIPVHPDSMAQEPAQEDTSITYPGITIRNGTALRFDAVAGRVIRSTPTAEQAVGPEYIRGGFVHGESGSEGYAILLHYTSTNSKAPFLITALSDNGTVIWQKTEHDLSSGDDVRGAHLSGNDITIVTDEDIIILDAATGTVRKTIDL